MTVSAIMSKTNHAASMSLFCRERAFEEIAERKRRKNWESMTLEEHMQVYESQGIARKEAMKLVAKDRGSVRGMCIRRCFCRR